jgi:hypothetical protein
MSDWSWKQATAERILQIVNEEKSNGFSIDDLYRYADEFSRMFPRNHHVKEKIRQILQRLRDDGFILFQGSGRYELNLAYDDLESDPVPLKTPGIQIPETKQVVRNIRLRNTLLGAEIKRRYHNICQVCRIPVPLHGSQCYAEAHHLWPLGSPHFGPDDASNILVLCPNHHAMFDRGAVTIKPDTLKILHAVEGVFSKDARLFLEPWHQLGQKYLKYHHQEIFEKQSLNYR